MAYRYQLTEEQWDKIKDGLPGIKGKWGGIGRDNRLFINAVIWKARTGAPWRDIPSDFGNWRTVHKRFARWSQKGIWQKIFNTLAVGEDTDWLMLDATIIKVHQHAAGGGKK